MPQHITDQGFRTSAGTSRLPWALPILIDSVIDSDALPDWSAAQWVAVLHAPQASQRVSRSAAERGMLGADVIERPEVARLLVWVRANWPGSFPAMAGALAAARQLQVLRQFDLDDAASYVVGEIHRARSRRGRPARKTTRLILLNPAELRAVEPVAPAPVTPGRIDDALDWMLAFVTHDVRSSVETCLDIEASLSLFLDWYVDRCLTQHQNGSQIPPIPPSRSLGTKQRLSVRVADHEMLRLLAGPPGSRRFPANRAWEQGMGYWAIVALLAWARATEPADPTPEAREWWAYKLGVLAARPPRMLGRAAVVAAFSETGRQEV